LVPLLYRLLCSPRAPPPPPSTLFPYTTLFRSRPPPAARPVGAGGYSWRDPGGHPGVRQQRRRRAAHEHRATSLLTHSRVTTWVTDRKSTRLNSSHDQISYAVFCLKKKTHNKDS